VQVVWGSSRAGLEAGKTQIRSVKVPKYDRGAGMGGYFNQGARGVADFVSLS